jgi:alpha-D-xyloside xylohydrolase
LRQDIEAAADGILSVETTHWSGALNKGPHFDLFPNGRPKIKPKVSKGEKGTTLSAGTLSATIHPDEHTFDIRFHSTDGSNTLTSLLGRSVGLAYNPAPSNPMQTGDMRNFNHYIFTQTTLGIGESVHGLGERFGAFNKVGQSISLWNADGGTSSDQAYKNVSFWLSSRGYGIFIDTPGKVELEIGSERCSRVQTSVEGQRLKWYIIYGSTPKEVLQRYSILTGKPSKVPSWSFGLWLSTSFTTNYDEATVNSFLEGMKERDTQVDVFHYDCFWMKVRRVPRLYELCCLLSLQMLTIPGT